MSTQPKTYSGPLWNDDQPDSVCPPEIKDPYFDEAMNAWVMSRYSDVLAVFRSSSLALTGANSNPDKPLPREEEWMKLRVDTQAALTSSQLREWQDILIPEVRKAVDNLSTSRPVDLVGEYAGPLCLKLAAAATEIDPALAERLEKHARHISEATAEPYDPEIHARGKTAKPHLHGCFHSQTETLRDPGFVALACTLPSLIAQAWFSLLQYPEQWTSLHHNPGFLARAIEELMRYGGFTRLLYRRVIEDVTINTTHMRKGDFVILRVAAANRDPERFPNPTQIDWTQPGAGHLTLGAGLHSCVGVNLIRMAVIALTRPLVERFAQASIEGEVKWRGGAVFRAPSLLPVRLREMVS